jgi:thiamine-monophosphate kinase
MDSEQKLIERIRKVLSPGRLGRAEGGLRLGIGDDAAILRPSPRCEWVVSCDAFLEGVHFVEQAHSPESIGYKSLARATSDLGAMGAVPRYFFLSLALPVERTGAWLNAFLAGMARAARELRIALAGGDTARHPTVAISITVIGEVEVGGAVTRSGANPGDLIYVSGRLGGAQLALELVLRGLYRQASLKPVLDAHRYPRLHLALGQWLARQKVASAMIDLSDGLSTDLARLCVASHAGARIWADRIPSVAIPSRVAKLRGMRDTSPLALALHGGEDYELLFTVPPDKAKRLSRAPQGRDLTPIGQITQGRQITLIGSDGRSRPLVARGWDHFRPRPPKK